MITRWRCSNSRKYKAVLKTICGCFVCWFRYVFWRKKLVRSRLDPRCEFCGVRGEHECIATPLPLSPQEQS